MEIKIQAYWGAKVSSVKYNKGQPLPSLEEEMSKTGRIILCDIIIDGKVIGAVSTDGKALKIEEGSIHIKNP